MAEELTEEQAQTMVRDFLQQKSNKHTFLTRVVETEDTTKLANLSSETIGIYFWLVFVLVITEETCPFTIIK